MTEERILRLAYETAERNWRKWFDLMGEDLHSMYAYKEEEAYAEMKELDSMLEEFRLERRRKESEEW